MAMSPFGEARKLAPWVSMRIPATPTQTAVNSLRGGWIANARLITISSSGITAMNRTTRPEAMVCSAKAVPPIPPPSISVPTSRAFRHCTRVGHFAPRANCQANNSPPAQKNRVVIMKKGGNPASAKRITR